MTIIFLLALLIPLIILFIRNKRRKHEEFWKHVMKIPGPKYYPILGTNYVLHTPESLFRRDRERAQKFYPIYKMWTFDQAAVVLFDPDDIEQILTNNKQIEKGFVYTLLHEWLGTGLLTSGGKKWHTRRKILTPAFHFNVLQEFVGMLNRETKFLVEKLSKMSSQPYIDVMKPITEFTLNSIGETSMGVQLRDDPKCAEYKEAIYKMGESLTYRIVRPWLWFNLIYKFSSAGKTYTKIVKNLHNFSRNLIQERKKVFNRDSPSYSERKRLGLLDLLLTAKENGADIDDEGIREEVDTFVFEGHDTTSISLSFTLMALANEPEFQEEIYKEIVSVLGDSEVPTFSNLSELKFMERCIKESLRLYPSVPIITRIVREEVKTKTGYIIPKGCNVVIFFYDLHRSPEIWDDPLKFDPDRFLPDNIAKRHPFAYLPFSAGSRNCIGQRFALLELKVALCGILKNFKLEPVDKPEDITYKEDMVLRPTGEVRVKFIPRIK